MATERGILTGMTMSELKALAQEKGIAPIGNKSAKQSWIDALSGTALPTSFPVNTQEPLPSSKRTKFNGSDARDESSVLAFLSCVAGIYGCFLYWGILQERIMTVSHFPSAPFLNLTQNILGALWSLLIIYRFGTGFGDAPISWYVRIAFTGATGSACGYAALKYISFPMKELGKSAKCIPTMLIGSVLYNKKYALSEYAFVMMVCIGCALFMLLKPSRKIGGASNSLIGIGLVAANLVLDGFTNSSQDEMKRKFNVTPFQLMFGMQVCSAILGAIYICFAPWGKLDEIMHAFENSGGLEGSLARDILLFGVLGALGQTAIFYTIVHFSSLTLTLVTTTRKLFTVIASIVLFNHHVSIPQWIGVALVFGGLGGKIFMDTRKKKQKTL